MAVLDMLHLLILNYPYGEPQPGMTLVALLVAKATYETSTHLKVDDRINGSMDFFLRIIVERFNPLPVIDSVTDALHELSDVILSNEPQNVATPTWQKVLNLSTTPRFFKSPGGESVMSHISDFGGNPKKVPTRLTQVMETGILLLTELITNAREKGYQLYDVQQERLVDLLTTALTTYRHLFKRVIMEYASALYNTIQPEQRFRELFKDEGDLNLAYYCIGRVIDVHDKAGGPVIENSGVDMGSWGTLGNENEELATFQ